jgi:gluconolactonase
VQLTIVADGLKFPEGPVALGDGSVVVVEVAAGRITRVMPDGTANVVAVPGGGPNGLALGPDGALYVCNNGGSMTWLESGGGLVPGPHEPEQYSGGRIERVDLHTGEVTVLYTMCEGQPLRSPNDIVFDDAGGFWFTDFGVSTELSRDRTAIYYALPDGSSIREAIFPLDMPNGISLSPDGSRLYTAESLTGRVWWWDVTAPGEVAKVPGGIFEHGGTVLRGLGGERDVRGLDSMAVDGEGWVCVATPVAAGITCVSPDGEEVEFLPTDDVMTTNICFGGPDYRTAYITLSHKGLLATVPWPRAGLKLPFAQ